MSPTPPAGRGGRPPGRVRRLLDSVADAMPPPRGDALVDAVRATRALVTGTPAPRPAADARRRDRTGLLAIRRARTALRDGDADEALRRADAILAEHPASVPALEVRRLALGRLGSLTATLETIHRLRSLADRPELAGAEAQLRGRLTETTPGWLPLVPGPGLEEPPIEGRVLHLLKESLPALQNGYTMRSRYSLLAQRSAGIEPEVVTSLGFPRRQGGDPGGPTDEVDGIRHHRLDLGPAYPYDGPVDVVVRDQAWLTAAVVAARRPALLQAGSGYRGYETALVALALRERFGIPVVYEVRSFLEAPWSSDRAASTVAGGPADPGPTGAGLVSELARRRSDQEVHAMLAADAVITIAAAMRDDIVARGVPADRVHVVPNGVDADAFRPAPADPELVRRYGIGGRPVFGYVSTLDHPREGHEVLIEAAAALRTRGRDAICLIVGDGARRPELEKLAQRLRVADRVVFAGRVPHAEVAAHYGLLDAFVVPRRDDRAARFVTPLKPFEAMAMAKPLVVADLPALTELAAPDDPEPRGLAFPVGDAAALATTLERLFDDAPLAVRLGGAGRAWVERERTWNRNGPRYAAIHAEALARAGRRDPGAVG